MRPAALLLAVLFGAFLACGGDREQAAAPAEESWSVTAWGEHYEVFPEAPMLAVGETAVSHTHVTVLDGFTPLEEGRVEVVLRGAGADQVFAATEASRPGIFPVEITPERAGEVELLFRVAGPSGREEIRGGTLRVGEAGASGALLRAPAPRGASTAAEPVAFLKEQQWQADFATAWVREGELAHSVRGFARLRPPAEGAAAVTAPVDAVLRPSPWPFPGQRVAAGAPLFRLVPRVSAERSLAELESRATGLEAELEAAAARSRRLDELLAVEAVSRREVEEAQSRERSLRASLEAARRDLATARAARTGGGGAESVTVASPLAGEVATVTASPGAAVTAGETLARVVRTSTVWVEVALSPEDARRVEAGGGAALVLESAEGPPRHFPADRVRRVAVAPEADPATGTVAVIFELAEDAGLPFGSTTEAQVLLAEARSGIVVPTSALVDDGGVTVVYLQLGGERFVRQEVHVAARQGGSALVEPLRPGQRLVTRGGDAIRRTTLMSSGEAQGHVH
jgi:RND family efflux transporter MFP subunit